MNRNFLIKQNCIDLTGGNQFGRAATGFPLSLLIAKLMIKTQNPVYITAEESLPQTPFST